MYRYRSLYFIVIYLSSYTFCRKNGKDNVAIAWLISFLISLNIVFSNKLLFTVDDTYTYETRNIFKNELVEYCIVLTNECKSTLIFSFQIYRKLET